MRCSLRDQKQFSGGCTACHRGMGAGGVGKAIGFADRHRDRSVLDPVEKLLGAIEKEFARVDVVHERCVADLDALRQVHDLERSRPAEHWSVPAEGTGPAKRFDLPLEGLGTGAIVNDVHALAASQAQDFVGKPSVGIDDDVLGASLSGDRDFVFGRYASDYSATP